MAKKEKSASASLEFEETARRLLRDMSNDESWIDGESEFAVKQVRAALVTAKYSGLKEQFAERDAARAEVERLREAAELALECRYHSSCDGCTLRFRAALEGKVPA